MSYLYIVLISILIVSALISVLLTNSRSSNEIQLEGNKLTIWHPLRKEVINLDSDLKSWNLQKVQMLWRGKLYSVNLELKSGKWEKVYFRSRVGKIEDLIDHLQTTVADKKTN